MTKYSFSCQDGNVSEDQTAKTPFTPGVHVPLVVQDSTKEGDAMQGKINWFQPLGAI